MVQRTNMPISKYRPGRLNSRRSRGTSASTTKTETNSNAFVYLQRKPNPISRPVIGQYHEPRKRSGFSTASQNVNIAAIQKKIDNASIVIRTAPTLKIGVTFKAMTAHRPAVAPNKRRAKEKSSRLVPAASKGLKKRTPNSFAPKTAVLERIAKAIPGPLLK